MQTRGYGVGIADYTLGDRAFSYPHLDPDHPGRRAPIEITGRVYYPTGHSGERHPMVVLLHGSWQTCADRAAAVTEQLALTQANVWNAVHPPVAPVPGSKPVLVPNPDQARIDAAFARTASLNRWPCAPGTPNLPSYRGFGYLGRALAKRGIMAVSISANGVNAVGLGDVAVEARAALINAHLALWATLDRTGGGPLAGRFTDPATGRPIQVQVRGSIDLTRIGTLGHSRGGKAVFWQAADAHRSAWPAGVQVRAVASLAPEGAAEAEPGTKAARNYTVSKLPFLAWLGTCDAATGDGVLDYVAINARGNQHQDVLLSVRGADHNFLNTEWSPSSGQVEAADDLDTLGVPRRTSAHCTEVQPSQRFIPAHPNTEEGRVDAQPQLDERAERAIASEYVTAFFVRELEAGHSTTRLPREAGVRIIDLPTR